MNHVGTNPAITEIERNGLPEDERKIVECPSCTQMVYEDNIKSCRQCGHQICPLCRVHICHYDWDYCSDRCAIADMVLQLREQDEKIWRLEHP